MKCFFKHKWKYNQSFIKYTFDDFHYGKIPSGINRRGYFNPDTSNIEFQVESISRICLKCYKKELKHIEGWKKSELTKEEERDFKLNSIGI